MEGALPKSVSAPAPFVVARENPPAVVPAVVGFTTFERLISIEPAKQSDPPERVTVSVGPPADTVNEPLVHPTEEVTATEPNVYPDGKATRSPPS